MATYVLTGLGLLSSVALVLTFIGRGQVFILVPGFLCLLTLLPVCRTKVGQFVSLLCGAALLLTTISGAFFALIPQRSHDWLDYTTYLGDGTILLFAGALSFTSGGGLTVRKLATYVLTGLGLLSSVALVLTFIGKGQVFILVPGFLCLLTLLPVSQTKVGQFVCLLCGAALLLTIISGAFFALIPQRSHDWLDYTVYIGDGAVLLIVGARELFAD
ncbi:hypothetical protein WDW37_06640 [Bdellovibrionota bacterium FG-1]